MTVGERIVARRKELGISQEKLAKLTGIMRKTLLFYEKDYSDMKLTTAMCIADVLGMTLNELVGKETAYKSDKGYRKEIQGEWIDAGYFIHNKRIYKCSNCFNLEAKDALTSAKYCPNCGSHMKGAE